MTKSTDTAMTVFKSRVAVSCHPVLARHWRDIVELEKDYERPLDVRWVKKTVHDQRAYAFVAEFDGMVVGWCLWKRDDLGIELLHLVVDRRYRRMSVGRQIVDELKRRLTTKARRIVAMVRETNDEAIAFFSSKEEYGGIGFKGVGVVRFSREAYEDEPYVDDYQFEYTIGRN